MDGTPFFWLADTVWAGPLLATDDEWSVYLRERTRQRFTAAQWVTTQFVGAPDGDREGELAFTGREQIALNPGFFQRLDKKLDALNDAGLLGVPVLLWAAVWGNPEVNAINPGYTLPDNEAIALARYMIARWGAHHVAWILNGDGDYRGEKADRWQRIGRAVFDGLPSRAPVMLHPAGMHWIADEFRDEAWVDIVGYQSGHGDDDATLRWIFAGPPATEWPREPRRPIINLEPPYEYHIAYQSKQRFTPHAVRRALYWSLLNAPTAGVTYGGHGVWGWDDGTKPPANHPSTGIPLPWREALLMPGAEHVAHIAELFTSIDWWRLRPSPKLLADQPGERTASEFIAVSRMDSNDVIVAYIPEGMGVSLRAEQLPEHYTAYWFDPRDGERTAAEAREDGGQASFMAPPSTGDAPHDWVLVLSAT
jgi:hypothetical protein